MTAILWLSAALLVVGLALVVTPVRLRLVARSVPQLRVRVTVAAFGGLMPAIAVYDSTRPRRTDREDSAHLAPRRRRRRPSAGSHVGPAFVRLVPDLIRRIHFDHFKADADFGLEDPADTGVAFGLAAPLLYGTAACRGGSVSLRPDFGGAHFSGTLDAGLHITPAALVPPALRFAWRAFGPGR